MAELVRRRRSGNAREPQNAILSYAALGCLPDPPRAEVPDARGWLASPVDLGRVYAVQKDELTDGFTRAYLQALVATAGGDQSEAARIAGLNRNHLVRMLAKHGLAKASPGADVEGDASSSQARSRVSLQGAG